MKAEIKEYQPSHPKIVMVWVGDNRKDGCLECVPRHLAPTVVAALTEIEGGE